MAANYDPTVPCHRVIRSDGTIGKYSGKGGTEGKRKLLRSEGVTM
jgi:O6-methylguanine-DNA--protein-cysteine methyltransferase